MKEDSGKGASLSAGALLGEPGGGGLLCWRSRRICEGGIRGRTSFSGEAPLGSWGLVCRGLEQQALETGISLHRVNVENYQGGVSVHRELRNS